MKKFVLTTMIFGIFAFANAQKYVDSMYASGTITVSKNLSYATGYSILTGSPTLDSLRMDIYNPTGNTDAARPLIIFCHTGNFLPRYFNTQLTGARDDSATVAFCRKFAEKGYVVASISYRLGWLPTSPQLEIRRGTIINAAYRGVQDLSAAVRYFKKSVADGNQWDLDSTKIVVGGQGTGGYITLAFATLDRQSEIRIDKFYDFTNSKWMVEDSAKLGDLEGFKIPGTAGVLVSENHKGHTSDVAMAFNIGGALGDSSWIEAGEIPIISAHGIEDLFAPYKDGIVSVPGTNPPLTVVDVSGSYSVIKRITEKNNNTAYRGKIYGPLTDAASKLNDGLDGLFPIAAMQNAHGPWEWWADTNYLKAYLGASGFFSQAQISKMIENSYAANPLMSKARAIRFIDSIEGYFAPRIAVTLGYIAGIDKVDLANFVTLSPNPNRGVLTIQNSAPNNKLRNAVICDVTGKIVETLGIESDISTHYLKLNKGMYFVQLNFERGTATEKLMIQ